MPTICFKHQCMMSQCKCYSPNSLSWGGSRIRIPKKGHRNRWRQFKKWLLRRINLDYQRPEQREHLLKKP